MLWSHFSAAFALEAGNLPERVRKVSAMTLFRTQTLGLTMAALLIGTAAASPAHAQQTLKWKFTKGQKLGYEMTQKMTMSTMAGGMAFDMKMTNIMDMTWSVTGVKSDGSGEITQKVTRVRMTMTGLPTGKIEYDSSKENPPGNGGNPIASQLQKTYGALVGSDIMMTISPQGRISNLKLSDKAKAALKGAGRGVPGGGISEDTFKQMASQMGAFFPKGQVTKGQTWDHKFEMKNPVGDMKIETKFKYAGTVSQDGKRLAKLELTPKVSMTPKAGGGAKITMKDKGSKGESYFDLDRGVLTRSTLEQNLEMQVSAGGIMSTMTMKGTTEMKLK